MSKERIIKALEQLGLSNTDTQIYLFLAKNGPHELRDIASALSLYEKKVQRSLSDLQTQKIVRASIENPSEFTAMPFEEMINLLIEIKKEKAKAMQESKEELLSSWRTIIKRRRKES